MKKIFNTIVIVVTLIIVSAILMSNKTGSVAEYCGDPAGGYQNCTFCHNDGSATFEAGMISSNIPASGYIGDSIYTITATINSSGTTKFGFEISPQDSVGNLRGVMTIGGSDMQLVAGSNGKYITHTLSGNTGSSTRSWTFTWKAPTAGTGNVTFYGAFNAADGDNTDQGDYILLSRLMVKDASIISALTATFTQSNGCYNANNGTASVTPVGGTAPFTYKWSNSAGIIPNSTNQTMSGLSPDTYSCMIKDSRQPTPDSCVITIVITNPPTLIATLGSTTHVLCRGGNTGAATINASGGTGSKTFSWSPTGGNAASATGLLAGNYNVTVTDANNCSTAVNISITEPTSALAVSPTSSAGTVIANASGGTPPYTYSWSPGGGTSDTISGLSSGTYTVTVTDKNGCTVSKSVDVVSSGISINKRYNSPIKIYPNPNYGSFSVEINTPVNQFYLINIVNSIGEVLFSHSVELNAGSNFFSIDHCNLNDGLYFIQFISNKGMENIPFIITL
ncbi:MAG: choice-of-anchor V domain-containing protein [Bacteroidota bacterium]|nr:choice-of-anchor V domain-containing protein [Bacteroidota bacterium]